MNKFCVIGLGKLGQIRSSVLRADAHSEYLGGVDLFDASLNENYSSTSEIFSDPNVDGVFICTTNNHLKPLTVEALQAGKHVFCEKPPAFNAEEVREIQSAEKQSNKILMYGFNHRLHGAVKKMKDLVDSGEFGRILWMRGRYGKSVDDQFFSTWRADRDLAGGGILLDQGIHMLDLFLYLGGTFDDVRAFVSNLYWNLDGVEDNVFAIMKNTETGLVASLHSTMTQWRHLFSLEVFLETGYMVLNGLRTSSETYGDEVLSVARNRTSAPAATWEDEERFVFETDSSMTDEVAMFVHAIVTGKRPASGNSDDALAVMELIDEIYKNDTDARNGIRKELTSGNQK